MAKLLTKFSAINNYLFRGIYNSHFSRAKLINDYIVKQKLNEIHHVNVRYNNFFTDVQQSAQSNDDISQSNDAPQLSTNDMTIQISDSCVNRMKNVIVNDEYLRIEVEGGGCSGFQYKYCLTQQLNPDDRVFERDGVRVVIDETSLEFLNGATVDYGEELIKSSFRIINNPQTEHGCSCGASFAVKIDKLKT